MFYYLSYSKIIITPASKAWLYIRVILSVFPSICPPDCTIVSISFLSKWIIRSFYCPPWLLKTWGCVIVLTQGHLGKVQRHWEEECTMRVRTIYLLSVNNEFPISHNDCFYPVSLSGPLILWTSLRSQGIKLHISDPVFTMFKEKHWKVLL